MTPEDLHTLCLALGFSFALNEKGLETKNQRDRAIAFAALTEIFCTQATPQFDMGTKEEEINRLDKIIELLKSDMHKKGAVEIHKDHTTLMQIYNRLGRRFSAYASDGMIVDHVLEMLDAELRYDKTLNR